MPISANEIKYYYSGGTSNTVGTGSIGQGISSTEITDNVANNIFDGVSESQISSITKDYRGFFIKNEDSEGGVMKNVTVWRSGISGNSGTTLRFTPTNSAKNTAMETIANDTTIPSGSFTWGNGANKAAGANIGNLNQNDYRGVWVERTVPANAPQGDVVISFICEVDTN